MATTTTLQSASNVTDLNMKNAKDNNTSSGNVNNADNLDYPIPTPTMEKQLSSTPFWTNDPLVLFKKDEMMDIWPAPLMSIEQKLNAISRIVILLSVLGFLITKNINILFTGLITLAIFVMIYKLQHEQEYNMKTGKNENNMSDSNSNNNNNGNNNTNSNTKKEGFVNSKLYTALKPTLTTPSVTNPMMNVLLPEIAYNPERNQAAPAYNPKVEKDINHTTEVASVLNFEPKTLTEAEKLRKKLFADLGDKYEFDDSMRSFYTNPSTTIPNDQKAFAEFCYGSMISCKEGNEYACQRFNPVLGSVIN
jgi:hypothetical protein